jgi:hypothetical protein
MSVLAKCAVCVSGTVRVAMHQLGGGSESE